jgi:hypothetical protein
MHLSVVDSTGHVGLGLEVTEMPCVLPILSRIAQHLSGVNGQQLDYSNI